MTGPAQPLLDLIRAELHEPGLGYAEPLTPITGGYDTRIFAFRLSGAAEPFSIPLILRLLGNQYPAARALSERATQNALAGLGYPAPRVLLASADPSILGGPFLVMERLAGRPLLDARWLGVASAMVEMQTRLHALDAEVLLQALDREGQASSLAGGPAISREAVTFDGHLARLERRIARGNLRSLEQAMAWLLEHRPTGEHRHVICHGDFHPQNILMTDGRVTGVIDWPHGRGRSRVRRGLDACAPGARARQAARCAGAASRPGRDRAAYHRHPLRQGISAPETAGRCPAHVSRSTGLHARAGQNGGST